MQKPEGKLGYLFVAVISCIVLVYAVWGAWILSSGVYTGSNRSGTWRLDGLAAYLYGSSKLFLADVYGAVILALLKAPNKIVYTVGAFGAIGGIGCVLASMIVK